MATAEDFPDIYLTPSDSSEHSDTKDLFVTESYTTAHNDAETSTSAAFPTPLDAGATHYFLKFVQMLARYSHPIQEKDIFFKSLIEKFLDQLGSQSPTIDNVNYFKRSILPPIDTGERFIAFYKCVQPHCDLYLIFQPMPRKDTWKVFCAAVVEYIDIKSFLDENEEVHFVQSVKLSENYPIPVRKPFHEFGWYFYKLFSQTVLKKDVFIFAADPCRSNISQYQIGLLAYKGAGSADISTVSSRFKFFD